MKVLIIGIGFPIELFETVSQSARSFGELMTLNLLWVLLVGCAAFLMARRMRSPGKRIAVAGNCAAMVRRPAWIAHLCGFYS
ncbi:MAG: hypothetical protein VX346_06740 [Planctomycetota bacterium]|nr:hypothetical protein [Planctomycetota bacterium]